MKTAIQVTPQAMLVGAGLIVGAWLIYKTSKVASAAAGAVVDAVGTGLQAVNPVNQDNIFYSGVNAVGAAIAGDQSGSWTLGGWIYDVTHADPMKPPPVKTDGYTGSW